MGFYTKPTTPTSATPTASTPQNPLLDVGGGVTAPADAGGLLDLFNRLNRIPGVQTTVIITPSSSTATVTRTVTPAPTPTPHPVTPTTPQPTPAHPLIDETPLPAITVVQAVYIADFPPVSGTNHAQGTRKVSNGSVVVGIGGGAFGSSANGKDGWAPVAFPSGMTSFEMQSYQPSWNPRLMWSGTMFVAFGFASSGAFKILTSATGAVWNVYTPPFSDPVHTVLLLATSGSTLVASDGGNQAAVSSDGGATWGSPHNVSSTRNVVALGYNGSHYTALTQDWSGASFTPATSPDGVTWADGTTVTIPTSSVFWGNLLRHNSGFLTYATKGSSAPSPQTPLFFYSADGTTFAASTIPAGLLTDLSSNAPDTIVTASNGTNLVVLSKYVGGATVFTSADNGATFTAHSTGAASSFKSIVAHNGLFILYSATDDSRRYTSPDGIVWTEYDLGSLGISITQADVDAWNARRGPDDILAVMGADAVDALAGLTATLPLGLVPMIGAPYWDPALGGSFIGFFRYDSAVGLIAPDFITIHDGTGRFYDADRLQWSDTACQTYPANIAAVRYAARLAPAGACIVQCHYGAEVDFFLWAGIEDPRSPAAAVYREGKLLDFTTGYFVSAMTSAQWLVLPQVKTLDALWGRYDFAAQIRFLPEYIPDWQPLLAGWTDTVDGKPAQSNPFTLLVSGGATEVTSPPAPRRCTGGFTAFAAPPLPFASRAGMVLATSAIHSTTARSATTQHTGLPFTAKG